MKPVVYLLCGLPYSGKTTYAKMLERDDVVRLTLDEERFALFGRHELPEKMTHQESEQKTKAVLRERMAGYLKEGTSVILDWGFWKKTERDEVQRLVREFGGEPRLLYFTRSMEELKLRINKRDLALNHEIDEAMLETFAAQFEEPSGEGEILV